MKKYKIVTFGLVVVIILFITMYFNNQKIENLETAKTTEFSGRPEYKINNYDVQYHETVDQIEAQTSSGSWLLNNGKLEFLPWSQIASQITFYKPGTFDYGGTTWVPTYEEAILLSKKP